MTGFVAWGQYRYRRPWAGYNLVDAVKQHAFDWGRGRFPENFSGSYYRPMDATVPHQFFATSMLPTPLLSGAVGWEPDAPRNRATLAPQLPPGWDRVRISSLRVGATTLDVDITRAPGQWRIDVVSRGPDVDLDVLLPVPLGARAVQVQASEGRPIGPALKAGPAPGPHDAVVTRTLHVVEGEPVFAQATWSGGLSVAAPLVDLVPGQPSTGVRVVDFIADGDDWLLELEGQAGSTYELRLYGPTPSVAEARGAAAELHAGVGVGSEPHRLRVTFAEDGGRRLAHVRLRATSRPD
jgi:hypothetical protein